jgi:methionyl-tRNA formyltransferase
MQSLRIVFFGNERIATGIVSRPLALQALLDSPHEVVAVVVHRSDPAGRKAKVEPVMELAEQNNIPILNPTNVSDIKEQLRELNADCGVLIAYGKIVPQEVIDIFPGGILNLHPSLLPNLRGSTPVETALLDGLDTTGVSIMGLVHKMDAGPVYAQQRVPISTSMGKQALADELHACGVKILFEVLDKLVHQSATYEDQDEQSATFTKRIEKNDGLLDWSDDSVLLERKIRAYAGWPGAWTNIGGLRIKICSAVIEEIPIDRGDWVIYNSALYFSCGDGKHIRVDTLQPENKKEMPILAFLNGYKNQLGS